MKHSDFDIRMKENYEKRAKTSLVRRIPVIIRVDGKAFHTFCKRFERPYDKFLNESLNEVMKFLCENIQGAKFAERHSDEISILVTDFDTINTDAYFDYSIQKICSVVASMATAEFCRLLMVEEVNRREIFSRPVNSKEELEQRTIFQKRFTKQLLKTDESWPTFDTRCFNLPREEIANYVWWRMSDAKRGSINMVAQANFSHKSLQNLSCDQMQEKLWQEKQINWAKLPQGQKIGFTCRRHKQLKEIPDGPQKGETVERNVWLIEESPDNKTELDSRLAQVQLITE